MVEFTKNFPSSFIHVNEYSKRNGALEIQPIEVTHVYYLELWEIYSISYKPTIRRENTLQAVHKHTCFVLLSFDLNF